MEIYIYQWKAQTLGLLDEKGEEKKDILTDYKRSYFPNFSLVLSANMY